VEAAAATAAAAAPETDVMAVDEAPQRGPDCGDNGSTTTSTSSDDGGSDDGGGGGSTTAPPPDTGDPTPVDDLPLGPPPGGTLLTPAWAADIPPYPSELCDDATLLADTVLAVTLVAGADDRRAPTAADAAAVWAAAGWLVEDLRARFTATSAGATDALAELDVWAASRRRRAEAVFLDTPFPLVYEGWGAGARTPPPGSRAGPFFEAPGGGGAAATAVAPPPRPPLPPSLPAAADEERPLPLLHTLLTVLCEADCIGPWHVLGALVLVARARSADAGAVLTDATATRLLAAAVVVVADEAGVPPDAVRFEVAARLLGDAGCVARVDALAATLRALLGPAVTMGWWDVEVLEAALMLRVNQLGGAR